MSVLSKKAKRGRVFPSVFTRASLTLEAALVVPIFLFVITSVIYFTVIISVQIKIQSAMEETADDLSTKMYATDLLSEVVSGGLSQLSSDGSISQETLEETIEDEDACEEILTLVKNGITALWLNEKITGIMGEDALDATYIEGGADGLDFSGSTFDEDSGIGDIVVNYTVNIPFLSADFTELEFTQRCRFRFWTGLSLTDDDERDVVYITTTGTVYHTDINCYHLDLTITAYKYSEISSLRNSSGSKYTACSSCVDSLPSSQTTVYITPTGTKYHTTLGCSGLKRGIITISIEDVGDMPACSACAGE